MSELTERLRDYCRDWDGTILPDPAETRVIITCGEIRGALAAIEALEATQAELVEMLKDLLLAGDFRKGCEDEKAVKALLAKLEQSQ